jgi:hypothetical protein
MKQHLVIWSVAVTLIMLINHGFPNLYELAPTENRSPLYRLAFIAALAICVLGIERVGKYGRQK